MKGETISLTSEDPLPTLGMTWYNRMRKLIWLLIVGDMQNRPRCSLISLTVLGVYLVVQVFAAAFHHHHQGNFLGGHAFRAGNSHLQVQVASSTDEDEDETT